MEKGHYGQYSGNARHSHKHHMVNSWEEEDVKRGRKEMAEGHKGHAEALFDDAHGSYNWDGHNSTGAEHHGMSRKSKRSDRLRERAMKRSERSGAERGDSYDYEDPRVMKMLKKASQLDERSNSKMMSEMGRAAGNLRPQFKQLYKDAAKEESGGPRRMTGHGQSKGDQSATHTDYAHYKGTDKGYHGHTGASHGDQSATHRDYMVDPRTHNSPLHNTGWSGFNYNKAAAELDYMPIEHDMHRGMSRESSELKDMPIVDIEKGDAEGDKYKKVINKAMMQKATKAEVSAKLREMFPEVKNNSVEVNWSPDGKKVEVYKKDSPLNAKGKKSKKELEQQRDAIEDRIRKQNSEAKLTGKSWGPDGPSPKQNKRLEKVNKQISKGVSRIASPLNAKKKKSRDPNKHVNDSIQLAQNNPAKAAMTYGTNLEESLKGAHDEGIKKNQWRLENNPDMDLSKYGELGEEAHIQNLQMGKFDDDIQADFNREIKRGGDQLNYIQVDEKGLQTTDPMKDFPRTKVTRRQIENTRDRYMDGDERSGIPRIASPLNAKGDKCPESGCVQEKGDGKWGVISGKTGKWWDANYESRSSAEAGLRAYFANGGN